MPARPWLLQAWDRGARAALGMLLPVSPHARACSHSVPVPAIHGVLWMGPHPSLCCSQSLKILGEKVSEISLNRDTVSEILRCFLTARGAGEELCEGLRTKPFQALPPDTKASILAFLVDELNGSALIIRWVSMGGAELIPTPPAPSPSQRRLPAARSTRPWRAWPATGRTSGSSRAGCAGGCCLGVPLRAPQ